MEWYIQLKNIYKQTYLFIDIYLINIKWRKIKKLTWIIFVRDRQPIHCDNVNYSDSFHK